MKYIGIPMSINIYIYIYIYITKYYKFTIDSLTFRRPSFSHITDKKYSTNR